MKKLIFVLLMIAAATAAGAEPRIAVVTGIVRGLEVQPVGASWKRAEVWMQLAPGDALRSGAGQMASVLFADGTQFKMDEKTEVVVKAHTLEARRGKIWMLVQGNRKPYQVTTPNAVAGIEGTELEIEVGESGGTTVRVLKGTVAVKNAAGAMRVSANQTCEVVGAGAPSRAAVKYAIYKTWTTGVQEYTQVKAEVEAQIARILAETDRFALTTGSVDDRQRAVQAVLGPLEAQIVAFAEIEPPPVFASAHAHRQLALDTLGLALRVLQLKQPDPAAVRALVQRARKENQLAEKQYERFGQLYEQVRKQLSLPN